MFVEAMDESEGMVVWLLTGRTNTDDDYRRYCESIVRANAIETSDLRVAVLVTDPGNPLPDARWRREIAEVSRDIHPGTLFILVGSAMVRGVATAINWIRPPTYQFRTAPTFLDAVLQAEAFAGRELPRLRELYAEARGAVHEVA